MLLQVKAMIVQATQNWPILHLSDLSCVHHNMCRATSGSQRDSHYHKLGSNSIKMVQSSSIIVRGLPTYWEYVIISWAPVRGNSARASYSSLVVSTQYE